MLDDVFTVKGGVFDESVALFAVKNLVFEFALRPTSLDHQAERVGRSARRVGDVWRNEEGLAFADDVIDDVPVFVRLDEDIALELVEKLFALGLVEVISSVRTSDDHREKVRSAVQVLVANRRLEVCRIVCSPLQKIDWGTYAVVFVETVGVLGRVWVRECVRLGR